MFGKITLFRIYWPTAVVILRRVFYAGPFRRGNKEGPIRKAEDIEWSIQAAAAAATAPAALALLTTAPEVCPRDGFCRHQDLMKMGHHCHQPTQGSADTVQ